MNRLMSAILFAAINTACLLLALSLSKSRKRKPFALVLVKRRRERMDGNVKTNNGGSNMATKLDSVPKGFRDIYTGVADEPIGQPTILPRSGDATQSVSIPDPTDPKTIELIVNGDGTIGSTTAFAVQVQGHVGDDSDDIVTEFTVDTISPDATEVTFTKVRREPIPAPQQ